jgi:hypothetical protein
LTARSTVSYRVVTRPSTEDCSKAISSGCVNCVLKWRFAEKFEIHHHSVVLQREDIEVENRLADSQQSELLRQAEG